MAEQAINILIKMRADIDAALAQVKGGMQQIEKQSDKANASILQSVRNTERPFVQAIGAITRIGFVWGATVGVMVKMVSDLGAEMDDLDVAASRLGITAGELSRQIYGFNIKSESAILGTRALQNNVHEARTAFEKLKVAIAEAYGEYAIAVQQQGGGFVGWARNMARNVLPGPATAWFAPTQTRDQAKAAIEAANEEQKKGSAESLKIQQDLVDKTNRLTYSEYMYKEWAFNQELIAVQAAGVDKIKLREYAVAREQRLEEDKTLEIKKQIAIRLKAEGDTYGVLKVEQEIALEEYKRKWGGEGEAVEEFKKGQEKILDNAKYTALGFKETWQKVKEDYTKLFGDVISGTSKAFAQMIVEGKNFGESMKEMFKNWAEFAIQKIGEVLIQLALLKAAETAVAFFGFFHEGGMVMHSGGVVRAHSGLALASDEVPIIAQRGEGILSRRGMAAIGGAPILNAFNSGRAVGGVVNTYNVNISINAAVSEEQDWDRVTEEISRRLRREIDRI